MSREVVWNMMPALRSPWFVPHVSSYMLSYALAAVAFAVTVTAFFKKRFSRVEDVLSYEDAAHELIRLALPFMTFGLFSGAIWAEEAWGAYWSWDSKETWSLITWTLYFIFIHCRRHSALRRFAGTAHVLAFFALLSTFFLVNLLPRLASLLHSYA
jgi:ABC-type transport system involved in cytochrome c biogenesis permease subunit